MPVTKSQVTTPRRRQAGTTAVAHVPEMTPLAKQRQENLDSLTQIGVAAAIFTRNFADAGAIAYHAPPFNKALAKHADQDEKLAKFIDYLGAIGPYSGIITAGFPLVLQLLANHGRVPAEAVMSFGVVPPAMLEQKMRLDLTEQQAAMQKVLEERQQALAEADLTSQALFTPNGSKVATVPS